MLRFSRRNQSRALFPQTPNRQQIALFSANGDENVGADDIVRYVDALVDEFELSAIESCYDTVDGTKLKAWAGRRSLKSA